MGVILLAVAGYTAILYKDYSRINGYNQVVKTGGFRKMIAVNSATY